MVESVLSIDNFATTIKSGRLHVFHNNSYHIGRLYQLGTRVDPHNCRVVGLEVVSEGSLLRLGHSGFSMDQENGTIMVCILHM